MNKTLFSTITIPKPCNEGWENMTAVEKGRFCASCQRVVRDFTNAPYEEIVTHYQQNNGKVCGHFNVSQLIQQNKEIQLKKFSFYTVRIFCLSALLAFGTNLFVITSVKGKNILESFRKTYLSTNITANTITIKGKIIENKSKETIAGALINLFEDGKFIKKVDTDISGNFILNIPENSNATTAKFYLNISCFGYDAVDIPIDPANNKTITIKLNRIKNDQVDGGFGLAN